MNFLSIRSFDGSGKRTPNQIRTMVSNHPRSTHSPKVTGFRERSEVEGLRLAMLGLNAQLRR
jgi:hypothetical protein